jgi:hypothetical protein
MRGSGVRILFAHQLFNKNSLLWCLPAIVNSHSAGDRRVDRRLECIDAAGSAMGIDARSDAIHCVLQFDDHPFGRRA